MNVLAIDPGPEKSAFVFFQSEQFTIQESDICDNAIMLDKAKRLPVEKLAIEMIEGFGLSVGQSVFDTVFWSGRFCETFQIHSRGEFVRIGRKAIKSHLCNTTTAKDSHVREALIYKFGGIEATKKGGKLYGIKSHLWAALAVAVTFVETRKV